MNIRVKTIILPRNLFIANQVILVSEVWAMAYMYRNMAKKRWVAENEYLRLLSQTVRVMDYADQSLMPQELIDDIKFRCMAALSDETADPLDTPESES